MAGKSILKKLDIPKDELKERRRVMFADDFNMQLTKVHLFEYCRKTTTELEFSQWSRIRMYNYNRTQANYERLAKEMDKNKQLDNEIAQNSHENNSNDVPNTFGNPDSNADERPKLH
ncbi:hypothetical protein ACOME3_001307 [Neoechinorhynchus agilis]